MKKLLFGLLLFFFGYSVFVSKVIAAQNLSISNSPSIIDQSQEFSINTLLSCSGCSDSYLRGVFYPSGTSYFGYTQDNAGNWSNAPGANCTTYFKIGQSDLQGGSWSGTLKFKPDKDSAYYNGPGEYLFKVGRYTSSCNSPSVWSAETTIAITGPTPSPTPSPTPGSTPTPSPTPSPAPAPTVRLSATPKPSAASILVKSTGSQSDLSSISSTQQYVITPTLSPSAVPKGEVLGSNDDKIQKIMGVLGFISLIIAGIVFFLLNPGILNKFRK